MKDKTCCFTGHRPEKLKRNETQVKEALERAIEAAVSRGFTHFISGMARGVDLWAAQLVLELKKQNPDKMFYTLTENQICTDMKLITPEKVLQVLKEEINEVKVPEKVRIQAGAPLEKMLMLAR